MLVAGCAAVWLVLGLLGGYRYIDRYVVYLAPALFGGSDGRPLLDGPGARSIDEVWRGRALSVDRLGEDLRIVLAPAGDLRASAAASALAGVEAGQ